ncbi:MAG TPA: antibiotic biosynthesis monooxygenase family protein [Desulfosarcina sp.]|nr:antibiotic biosynthesis monooxygenase family protein [Desulfosarcina sp.]
MIKVHIRRQVTEENQQAVMELVTQLRATITGHPGYLSSETLKRVDPPGEILVVSKWKSLFYWRQWFESRERVNLQDRIEALLQSKTQYEIYEYA